MKTKLAFRMLVGLLLMLLFWGPFLPTHHHRLHELSHADLDSMSDAAYADYMVLLDSHIAFGLIAVVVFVASCVGLLLFWNPARVLFLVGCASVWGFSPPSWTHGTTWMFWVLELVPVGMQAAIIALMFTPPIRRCFERSTIVEQPSADDSSLRPNAVLGPPEK